MNTLKDTSLSKYAPGQVWTYKTRLGEESSTLTIVKVETNPTLGVIVHVSLEGLRIPNEAAPTGFTHRAAHLPFAEKAIDASVKTLVRSSAPSEDYREGYDEWRKSFDNGHAGIFMDSVADAVDAIAGAFNNRPRQSP
jgi:hypothetical protein